LAQLLTQAMPLDGGKPVLICGRCFPAWTTDGTAVYISMQPEMGGEGFTAVIPLKPEAMLPPLPPAGIRDRADLEKIPGARIVPFDSATFAPGLASYAYTKINAQRNLYRIPLP
jgi:hypothetical protein